MQIIDLNKFEIPPRKKAKTLRSLSLGCSDAFITAHSPGGLLNIYQLLSTIGKTCIPTHGLTSTIRNDYNSGSESSYTVYTIFDIGDVETLRFFLDSGIYSFKTDLIEIQLISHKNGCNTLEKKSCIKEYSGTEILIKDLLLFAAMHRCRSLLAGNQIKSYVLSNYTYHALPGEFWHYAEHWYRLLADGRAQGNVPSIGDFFGDVYFNKEDVMRCLDSDLEELNSAVSYSVNAALPASTSMHPLLSDDLSLINLNTYITPWLQVLNAVYEEYGKDKLAEVKKDNIQRSIEEHIKKHQLNIASTDIPYLAKFIRLAEQKEGKKYHAKRKKQQQHSI
jgi:hypothetical protein